MSSIFQLKITLKYTNPEIYRTILIDKGYDFYIFHLIIQGLMNWTGEYYYEFTDGGLKILDDNLPDYEDYVLSSDLTLQEVFHKQNDEITYVYDEEDVWEISIRLEKILPRKANQAYPVCIDGKYNSPPEDCGGITAFNDYLSNYPKTKFDGRFVGSFTDDYDPGYFNLTEKNSFLAVITKKYYEKSDLEINEELLDFSGFDGYNYDEMELIVSKEFSHQWPIILKNLSDDWLAKVPILNMILFVMKRLDEDQTIRLTAKGNFPRNLIQDLYFRGFYKEELIEHSPLKRISEDDSFTIRLTHILLELLKYTKKRHNRLSLTQKGKNALKDKNKMLHEIFITFCNNYNWGYFDSFDNEMIGRFGFGYSIILLAKYGETMKENEFYADKYYNAFPNLKYSKEEYADYWNKNSYYFRTFKRFLHIFGLVEIEEEHFKYKIKKSQLFNHFFAILPPVDLTSQSLGLS
ncbi:MAG: plasmid pRiA4b ORF-3 family protein [Candidatus Marinimicrobia bacterium]|nr:plasmid pRiA4b ORF-3 family protein [Candidatus Neomarinimicrobiota bacterium]